MELLTSVLVAGGVCACIGAVKAVCRRLTKDDRGRPAPQEKIRREADFFNISPIFTAGSAASALQINAVQQVSARGGAEHAPAEILDGGA